VLAAAAATGASEAGLASRVAAALGAELGATLVARCVDSLGRGSAAAEWRDVPDGLFDATLEAASMLGRADWLASALDAELGAKERVKAVKRALHALRSRGVAIEPFTQAAAPSAFRARAVHDPDAERRSVISAPDGMGARLVVVIADVAHGVAFLEAIFRDETLVRVAGTVSARKQVRPMVRQLFATWGDALTSVDVSIGAGEILEAEGEGRIEAPSLRERVGELRPVLKPLAEPRQRLAEPALDENAFRRRAAESGTLFESPLFAGWMPDQHALLECGEKLHLAMASELVLNEVQRHEQLEGVFSRAVREYLSESQRHALMSRLRHASRFLLAAGRADEAERAWSAASSLAAGGTPPFVERMFRRFFDAPPRGAGTAAPPAEPSSEPRSRLVLPGSTDPAGDKPGGGLILP
jgi:hypothetical protein